MQIGSEITEKLNLHGISTTIGHDIENCRKSDLVVFSSAIKDEDPEMVIAKENNIPTVERGIFVGYLTKMYENTICVSGTHGKTSTTSMLSLCFINAGLDPTIQVGANFKKIGGNYRIGKSENFVLESCEYKENFLNFHPKTEIILNIDNDHLDYYKTFENVVNAFKKFASILDENGLLVTNADDPNCYALKNVAKSKVVTVGIDNPEADFIAKNIEYDNNGFPKFDVYKNNTFFYKFEMSVTGRHNVLNALTCIAVCDNYNISKDVIFNSLKEFTGADRRMEFKGRFNEVSVFDDYAHHPTEIEAISKAVKNKKYNETWAVFQPHTYSRTIAHVEEFAQSLSEFDHVILVDIYAAREKNELGITSQIVVDSLKKLGKDAIFIPDFNEVVKYLHENCKKEDMVLTLGAGTVTELGKMLVE